MYCPISERAAYINYARLIFHFLLNDIKVPVVIFQSNPLMQMKLVQNFWNDNFLFI